ncbi:MAG: diaminopimelate decarboxylase [Phycisphaerae bacterium]
MDYFEYRKGRLFCEGVAAADIAAAVGTPTYVYSAATLLHHYRAIAKAFADLRPTICYSVKSLSNVHILKLLAAEGSGFDVVSGGELARARLAGADPSRIAFAGVGKTDKEISEAIAAGIGLFNVESEAEFENLSRLAAAASKPGTWTRKVRAALRVNPDVYDAKTHKYTTTGKKETKFGVDIERAVRFFESYGRDENVWLDAIHIHIGSPIYSPAPYVQAVGKMLELIARLRKAGFQINALDIGGGFAADYEEGKAPPALAYAVEIVPLLAPLVNDGLQVILEPGRQISCNAGLLLTSVLYVKKGGDRNFVIVDAAMTDLVRPALYGAEHFIYPAALAAGAPVPPRKMNFAPPGGQKVDVVGGVCESSDFLAKDRIMPPLARGDLLAVFSTGAYGFSMSSQYNSRPRAAEVLVEADKWRVIRRRETYEDLTAAETCL